MDIGAGLYMYDVVVNSSRSLMSNEFLLKDSRNLVVPLPRLDERNQFTLSLCHNAQAAL